MENDVITFSKGRGQNKYVVQGVFWRGINVGELWTERHSLQETFFSISLRHKTAKSIINARGYDLRHRAKIQESEDNGFYEIALRLDDKLRGCDLILLGRRIAKSLREIRCSNCGKLLFYSDSETDVRAGLNEAKMAGVIYKLPFLYDLKTPSAFYCNQDCWHRWLMNNSTEERRKEVTEVIDKIKRDKHKIVTQIADGVEQFQNTLLEMNMHKDGAKMFSKLATDEQVRNEFIKDFITKHKAKYEANE